MEDFVTIEIAKKLEEKGFDYKCLYVYNNEQIINPEIVKAFGELSDDGYYELTKEGGGKLDWSFVYINEYQLMQYRDIRIPIEMIRAPTISQVLKWMREEKKIFVAINIGYCYETDVIPFPTNPNMEPILKGYYYGIWELDNLSDKNAHSEYFESPELAALAGIEYVLDNLI